MKKGEPNKISIMICGFALCDYKPKNWTILKEYLKETTVFDSPTIKNVLWLKTAASLCILDLYKTEVFEKALELDFIKTILSRGKFI